MHQRERIVDAVALTVASYGFSGLTVERVIESAKVSRSTFYTHFQDKRDAMGTAHESIFERFFTTVTATCDKSEWPLRVRNAIGAALEFAVGKPEQFQILFPGPATVDLSPQISTSHGRLAELLEGIRKESPHGAKLPSFTELFLIAGGGAVVSGWLAEQSSEGRRSLQQQLVELLLLPYYGRSRAARLSRRTG
ncbi:MAG TPA: TetR/AcrR family transcriptional regulator [Solirubrobacterales bacterium]|nr:TetR/AcrR family transcriptional regulator [Solirubrobacterales bacterium]